MILIEKAFEEYLESIEDPDKASSIASSLLSDWNPPKAIPGEHQQGRKRHPGDKRYKLPLLKGVTAPMSKKIRAAVALRYSGFNNYSIERMLGFSNKYLYKTELAHPDAFEEARQDIMRETLSEYYGNLLVIRGALTRSGHRAVKTLCDVMDDKTAAAGTRAKAAETILKLINIEGSSPTSSAKEIIDSISNFYERVREPEFKGTIVDAEVEALPENTYE